MTPRTESTAELLAWLQALTQPTAPVEGAAVPSPRPRRA
jgi:hypothetical protein